MGVVVVGGDSVVVVDVIVITLAILLVRYQICENT